jgi:hypothetical protein
VDAAHLLATEPMTLQLRYLQTLTEIGVEKNTTIVFPLPLDMMTLLNKLSGHEYPMGFSPSPSSKPATSTSEEQL